MICNACKEDYAKEFEADFVDGVCLPCVTQYQYDLQCDKEAKELNRFNKKYASDYDIDSFYDLCDEGDIKKSFLKGFPALRDIWKYMQRRRQEREYHEKMAKNKQVNLFEPETDLPF